jgi:hypothetical protein
MVRYTRSISLIIIIIIIICENELKAELQCRIAVDWRLMLRNVSPNVKPKLVSNHLP